MKFYQEGDKSRAICSHCEGLVQTTFTRRNVPFDDGLGEAKGVLVSVCNVCDQVVGIPAQSTPAIKAAREAAVVSIETRLPASYLDRLDQAMHVITTAAATKHRKMFLSLYIDFLAREQRAGEGTIFTWRQAACTAIDEKTHLDHLFNACPHKEESKRLSLKLNAHIASELDDLQTQSQLSRTDFIKHMICQMQNDVVTSPKEKLVQELTLFARAAV